MIKSNVVDTEDYLWFSGYTESLLRNKIRCNPDIGVVIDIITFLHEDPIKNSVVLLFTDDYNAKKENISYLGGNCIMHCKDTMWQHSTTVLSEKLDELIGSERLKVMG